jgi:predicted P-loop ATPase
MTSSFDFKQIAAIALRQATWLLPQWLPGGCFYNKHYQTSSLRGGGGSSLKVDMQRGCWKDFATEESGGDLISLYAAIQGISQKESARILADLTDTIEKSSITAKTTKPDRPKLRKQNNTAPVAPPQGADAPDLKHSTYGLPTATYAYRSVEGAVLFYVARYEAQGRKQIRPWVFNGTSWYQGAWPQPIPLYGLETLLDERPVLIVEGEKCRDAAQVSLPKYSVISWQGGAGAVRKANWLPLHNKRVVVWPDADEAGRKAALDIIEVLKPLAQTLKVLDVSDMPPKWDAADAFSEPNYTYAEWAKWAMPRLRLPEDYVANSVDSVDNAKSDAKPGPMPESMPEPTPVPHDIPHEVSDHTVLETRYVETEAVVGELLPPEDHAPMPTEPPRQITIEFGDAVHNLPDPIHAFLSKAGVLFKKSGQPIINVDSVGRVLDASPEYQTSIWYDTFHNKVMIDDNSQVRFYEDVDLVRILRVLQGKYYLHTLTKQTLEDAVLDTVRNRAKSEPREWLKTLSWDGCNRVSEFFATHMGVNNNAYSQCVSENFWVSMIARICKPGCKVDNMIVLEGAQGSLKSSALHAIGGKWFGELNERPDSKDFALSFNGKLLLEIAELDSFRRAENTTIKRIITTQTDRLRPPYGRNVIDFPRSCIFAGTTNEFEYLQDTTGGRRFWPLRIGKIDLDLIHMNREQLFAEAKHLYDHGSKWWVVPKEALVEQSDRTQMDPWVDMISDYCLGKPEVSTTDILLNALDFDASRVRLSDEHRVGRAMRLLGYEKKQVRVGQTRNKLWVKELSPDEIVEASKRQMPLAKQLSYPQNYAPQ